MKVAYSYIRFSTAQQGKEGKDSFRRQTTASREWCKVNGYTLSSETFFDAGKSAFKGEHLKAKGELKRFLSLAEDGKIPSGSLLLVENFDRLSRLPVVESMTLFLQIINGGIGVVFTQSLDKRIINKEAINKEPFLLQMIIGEVIRATEESARKSRLTKAAKQAKRQFMAQGNIVAHNNVPKYFSWDKDAKRYVHNERTDIVKELVSSFLDGKTLYGIADEMNKRGILTWRRGYDWSGNTVRQILRSRTLIGEFLGCKTFLPPVITQDEFDRVQNQLTNNVKYNRGKPGTVVNVFRGICFCSDCDRRMIVGSQSKLNMAKNADYRYLRCSFTGKHVKCKNRKNIRLSDVEKYFFGDYLKNPAQLLNQTDNKEVRELNRLITSNETRLTQLTSQIAATVELLSSVPLDELKSKLTKLNEERDAVKAELDNLNNKLTNIQDLPQTVQEVQQLISDAMLDFQKKIFGAPSSTKRSRKPIKPEMVYQMSAQLLGASTDQVKHFLSDNATRLKLRTLLPSLIGKMVVDTIQGRFYVYNRTGKLVYKSPQIVSNRNNSEVWRNACKEWGKKRRQTQTD